LVNDNFCESSKLFLNENPPCEDFLKIVVINGGIEVVNSGIVVDNGGLFVRRGGARIAAGGGVIVIALLAEEVEPHASVTMQYNVYAPAVGKLITAGEPTPTEGKPVGLKLQLVV
jgi:hypothetical protein